ncbi:thioredoxin-like protein, partial [Sistotremastrum niveocremeum HHB9708]
INSDEYSFFHFWETWSGPCRYSRPKFEQHSDDGIYPHVKFYSVNFDDCRSISNFYGLNITPTFVLYKNGDEVTREIGWKTDLYRILDRAVVKPEENS